MRQDDGGAGIGAGEEHCHALRLARSVFMAQERDKMTGKSRLVRINTLGLPFYGQSWGRCSNIAISQDDCKAHASA